MRRFEQRGYEAYASALGASAGRNDLVGDLRAGNASLYGQLTGTRAESDDYADGAGNRGALCLRALEHDGAIGWTPDDVTLVEVVGHRERRRGRVRRPARWTARDVRPGERRLHMRRDDGTGLARKRACRDAGVLQTTSTT